MMSRPNTLLHCTFCALFAAQCFVSPVSSQYDYTCTNDAADPSCPSGTTINCDTGDCKLNCKKDSQCSGLTVNAPSDASLLITCVQETCQDLIVNGQAGTTSIEVNCNWGRSCPTGVVINGNGTSEVKFTCSADSCRKGHDIDAADSAFLFVQTSDYITNANITCPVTYNEVISPIANTGAAPGDTAIKDAGYTCGLQNTKITMSGANDFNLEAAQGLNNLYIYCADDNTTSCVDSLSLQCNDDYSQSCLLALDMDNGNVECQDTSSACQGFEEVTCVDDEDCERSLNCFNYASADCDVDPNGFEVTAPADAALTINCANDACKGITIHGQETTTSITLNCNTWDACESTTINGNGARVINFYCLGFSCRRSITINAADSDSLTITTANNAGSWLTASASIHCPNDFYNGITDNDDYACRLISLWDGTPSPTDSATFEGHAAAFYAVEGLARDFNIECDVGDTLCLNVGSKPTLNCGADYLTSCELEFTSGNVVCGNGACDSFLLYEPSSDPTASPVDPVFAGITCVNGVDCEATLNCNDPDSADCDPDGIVVTAPAGANLTINCNKDACQSVVIDGQATTTSITLNCNDGGACKSVTINGNGAGEIKFLCVQQSCRKPIVLDAKDSDKLIITTSKNSGSWLNQEVEIYCPNNYYNQIVDDDDYSDYACRLISLYDDNGGTGNAFPGHRATFNAVEGLARDLSIECADTICLNAGTKPILNCGPDYLTSCELDFNLGDVVCDNGACDSFLVYEPSSDPTANPVTPEWQDITCVNGQECVANLDCNDPDPAKCAPDDGFEVTAPAGANLTINCDNSGCKDVTIHGQATTTSITLNCNTWNACDSTTINGNGASEINFRCHTGSCREQITLDATDSDKLTITTTSNSNSYLGSNVVIRCPNNYYNQIVDTDDYACRLISLYSGDGFGGHRATFYAVEGLARDLSIECSDAVCLGTSTLNCGADYSTSCDLDYTVDGGVVCDNGACDNFLVYEPSSSPTRNPVVEFSDLTCEDDVDCVRSLDCETSPSTTCDFDGLEMTAPANAALTIDCDNDACRGIVIHGQATTTSITLNCNTWDACETTTINGNGASQINFYCVQASCQKSVIVNATDSDSLIITTSNSPASYLTADASIYCPNDYYNQITDDDDYACRFISLYDGVTGDTSKFKGHAAIFYVVEGLARDLNIECADTLCLNNPTLNCGTSYTDSCDLQYTDGDIICDPTQGSDCDTFIAWNIAPTVSPVEFEISCEDNIPCEYNLNCNVEASCDPDDGFEVTAPANSSLTINCNNDACNGVVIHGQPTTTSITLDCQKFDTCRGTTVINGNGASEINFMCSKGSCQRNVLINGTESDKVTITTDNAGNSFLGSNVRVYCPQDGINQVTDTDGYGCNLITGLRFAWDVDGFEGHKATFYAVEGLARDLYIDCNRGEDACMNEAATLYCTQDFSESCTLVSDDDDVVSCSTSSICDTFILFAPTEMPGMAPVFATTDMEVDDATTSSNNVGDIDGGGGTGSSATATGGDDDEATTLIVIAVIAGVVLILVAVGVWYFVCRGEKEVGLADEPDFKNAGLPQETPGRRLSKRRASEMEMVEDISSQQTNGHVHPLAHPLAAQNAHTTAGAGGGTTSAQTTLTPNYTSSTPMQKPPPPPRMIKHDEDIVVSVSSQGYTPGGPTPGMPTPGGPTPGGPTPGGMYDNELDEMDI